MYGDAFYYDLDGTLNKTSIGKFLATHSTCKHNIEVFSGNHFEIREVPSMIRNFVFMECCGSKWFFKIENAQVNLMERLQNLQGIERLKIRQTATRNVFSTSQIVKTEMLLKELTNVQRGEIYI
jgi:hypothetical protein